MKIKITNKSNYPIPEYAHKTDSGLDVRANISEAITLKPLEGRIFPTGLYLSLPPDLECQVRPKSGQSKRGVVAMFGTVDSGYRGEIGINLINLSPEEKTIEPGEKIAQLVIAKIDRFELEESELETDTERGDGAYGSTGRF